MKAENKNYIITSVFAVFFAFLFIFCPKILIRAIPNIASLAVDESIVTILSSLKQASIAVDIQLAVAFVAICTLLVFLANANTKVSKGLCIFIAVIISVFGFVLLTLSAKVNSIPLQTAITAIISLLQSGII